MKRFNALPNMKQPKVKYCIVCQAEFKQFKSTEKVCSLKCAIEHAKNVSKEVKRKEWNKTKKVKKEALKTKKDYEKELEVIFNRFIRLRDKDLPCISCNAPAGTYKLTAGHFHPAGTYKNIRFNEDNVHGQCWYNCNKNKHGNLSEYRPALVLRIGQDRVNEIDRLRNVPAKYTIPELKEMKEYYRKKIKELK